MARRKRPKVNLSQPVQPKTGDLESLFATGDDVEQAAGLQLLALRLDAIEPDPQQPRNTFPEESLQELSESIKQDGVIQPIEVAQVGPERYQIVHGERRWRAAEMAGLETIPAVVRRRNYDVVTRFVRQLVENIQREDLNDVDRAAGLLRLREMMQEALDRAREEDVPTDEPWGNKITWAKVGRRLGYSRQRIHQLIKLLDLPEEIKSAVRDGSLSERDTRIYHGLKPSQMRALHRARVDGDVTTKEAKKIASHLKQYPQETVSRTVRALRQPPEAPPGETAVADLDPATADTPLQPAAMRTWEQADERPLADSGDEDKPEQVSPTRTSKPNSLDRLTWIRGHLARIQRQGLSGAERREIVRLLRLIEQDVASLLDALTDES